MPSSFWKVLAGSRLALATLFWFALLAPLTLARVMKPLKGLSCFVTLPPAAIGLRLLVAAGLKCHCGFRNGTGHFGNIGFSICSFRS